MEKKKRKHPKYEITCEGFDSDSDERGWYSLDLSTMGDNLQELLDNAAYFLIDQDGGEIGDREADDEAAHDYIVQEYTKLITKEANDVQT